MGEATTGSASEGGSEHVAEIRTFLIADVRGYTQFTQERGDEAAAKLAAKFAVVARAGVEGRGGSVIELRGDEALAVFGSARQAIRAAVDLQERFVEETISDPSLPLPVGIGLDAGEAVPVESGYRGGALNLAARLCGQAGPGEILASQEVTHLARKVDGVRYEDHGELQLKGLADPVRVIRVVPEAADPAERFKSLLPPPEPAPARRRALSSGRLLVGAIVVVVAIVAWALVNRGGTPSAIRSGPTVAATPGDAVVRIDPSTGGRGPSSPVGSGAAALAVGGGSVWVSDSSAGVVDQISEATNHLVRRIGVGRRPVSIAFSSDPGSAGVWVVNTDDGTVSRIDATSGTVLATIEVGHGVSQVVVAGDQVWVVNHQTGKVSRINPGSNVVIASFKAGTDAATAGAGAIWLLSLDVVCPTGGFCDFNANIQRMNDEGSDAEVLGTAWRDVNSATGATKLVVDGSTAWVTDPASADVVRVDLGMLGRVDPKTFPHIALTSAAEDLAVDASGNPWVVVAFSTNLFEISSVTNAVTSVVPVPGQPIAVAADASGVYALFSP